MDIYNRITSTLAKWTGCNNFSKRAIEDNPVVLTERQFVNEQHINHPQLSNPNWVKIGQVQNLNIYPLKAGGKMEYHFFRCNQHGMITKDHPNGKIWDGMFLIYNQETKTIENFSDYWPLITITASMKSGFMIFESTLSSKELTVDIDKKTRKNCKTFYYSSWYANTPIKLIDCGKEAATWINSCLQDSNRSLRLVQRDCDPLIEEPNFIKNNWTEYCEIYSTRADEKPEAFADVTRCVLMTTTTLHKLREEKIGDLDTYLFRPNIVVSPYLSTVPFSEEDWEWIKIRDTIIRMIKPVPKYRRFTEAYFAEGKNLYINANEEETAHLGVYCAPIVPGDIHMNDDVYVYSNNCVINSKKCNGFSIYQNRITAYNLQLHTVYIGVSASATAQLMLQIWLQQRL